MGAGEKEPSDNLSAPRPVGGLEDPADPSPSSLEGRAPNPNPTGFPILPAGLPKLNTFDFGGELDPKTGGEDSAPNIFFATLLPKRLLPDCLAVSFPALAPLSKAVDTLLLPKIDPDVPKNDVGFASVLEDVDVLGKAKIFGMLVVEVTGPGGNGVGVTVDASGPFSGGLDDGVFAVDTAKGRSSGFETLGSWGLEGGGPDSDLGNEKAGDKDVIDESFSLGTRAKGDDAVDNEDTGAEGEKPPGFGAPNKSGLPFVEGGLTGGAGAAVLREITGGLGIDTDVFAGVLVVVNDGPDVEQDPLLLTALEVLSNSDWTVIRRVL